MRDITIESGLQSMFPSPLDKRQVSEARGNSFGKILKDSIKEVNQLQHAADVSIEQLAAGKTKNLHETMIALEKADISFRLMMEVRNKIIDAYHEIMRMQV